MEHPILGSMHQSRLVQSAAMLAASVGAQLHQPCTTESLGVILQGHPEVTVNFVHEIAQNGTFGEGASNIPFPNNATQLPALCAVGINVKSSENSSYNFGLFLPDETWNERFLTTGNGGFGGGINWPDMGRTSQYGFATLSTDTGHSSNALDGSWGLNAPESIIDWGHRAMHGSVVLGKEIINAYYSSSDGIKYSYYASCSTGGRQGLREVQLHPDSFDAISVGAPAWWTPHLSAATLWYSTLNYPASAPGYIDPSLFTPIVTEMVKQCDPQDGLVDGIISDPYGCNFDYEALLCKSSNATGCLSPAQLEVVYKFYGDWFDSNQTYIFPGMSLGTHPGFMMNGPVPLGSGLFQYWVHNDSSWDISQFTYADIQLADEIDPGNASADDFDLSPYFDRGGKIIMYHGDVDALIPTKSSTHFYRRVRQTLAPRGVDLDDSFRFFLIPGMNHCSGSDIAPWYIGGGSQPLAGTTHSVPGYEDADHDVILSIMRWAEEDHAPDTIVASKFTGDNAANGLERQRPLCVYPKQAKHTGGDPDLAENWECKGLY